MCSSYVIQNIFVFVFVFTQLMFNTQLTSGKMTHKKSKERYLEFSMVSNDRNNVKQTFHFVFVLKKVMETITATCSLFITFCTFTLFRKPPDDVPILYSMCCDIACAICCNTVQMFDVSKCILKQKANKTH